MWRGGEAWPRVYQGRLSPACPRHTERACCTAMGAYRLNRIGASGLILCLGLAAVGCQGGEGKRKARAQQLASAVETGCTVDATGEKYDLLVVDCGREDDVSDARATKARALLEKRCAELVADGFAELVVQAATVAEIAKLADGKCTFKPREPFQPKGD